MTYIFVTAQRNIKRDLADAGARHAFTVLVGSLIELGGSYIALSFADYDLPFTTSATRSSCLHSAEPDALHPRLFTGDDFYSFLQPQLETS